MGPWISQITIKKKDSLRLTCLDFKVYYRAAEIKSVFWHKVGHICQRNKMAQEQILAYMVKKHFNNGPKTIREGKDNLFNQ